MCIYLYVKTHNKTGLKYLGKTTEKDPHKYKGSGKDWAIHLKEYGADYTTEILKECTTNEELNQWGRYYSSLWNVAESLEWANRIPETGGGGSHTEERKELFRSQQLGKKKPPRTNEHKENLSKASKGKPRPSTAEGLRNWYKTNPDRTDVISKQSESLKEWYRNNPEKSQAKSLKRWDSIYRKNYEKFKLAIMLIGEGCTNKEVTNSIQIDSATLNKFRSKQHRIFTLFPELYQLL